MVELGVLPHRHESQKLQKTFGGSKVEKSCHFPSHVSASPWGGELKARQEGESGQKICDSAAIRQPGQRWSQVEEGVGNGRARACLIINS